MTTEELVSRLLLCGFELQERISEASSVVYRHKHKTRSAAVYVYENGFRTGWYVYKVHDGLALEKPINTGCDAETYPSTEQSNDQCWEALINDGVLQ